ncbi:MAG: hypothetical protein WC704_07735 [Sphingomonas sp.]|jgi:hypothetical protein
MTVMAHHTGDIMRPRFVRAIAALPILIASTGASGGESESAHPAPQYVALDGFVVPIVDSNRLTGNLRLKIVLDAGDAANAEKVKLRLPILRQAAMGSAIDFARLHASPFLPVNAELLEQNLTTAMAGPDLGQAHVLITEVSATNG